MLGGVVSPAHFLKSQLTERRGTSHRFSEPCRAGFFDDCPPIKTSGLPVFYMPRFSVNFGRRKSTADNLENATVAPSFRVLERSEVVASKQFEGGVKVAAVSHRSTGSDVSVEDNIFADLKPNRGSGSSNTTKTTLTDNSSSRASNVSTAPSSADTGGSDEWRGTQRRATADIPPVPPVPKPSSGFLRSAGRTFSFGGQKKSLPPALIEESPPATPVVKGQGRPRAPTSSTSTTVTPPRVDQDFDLDLGGDFGKLVLGNDKRVSVATVKNEQPSAQMPVPRSLTGARPVQPTPINIDKTTKVDPPAHSWSSHHSNDHLITSTSPALSPGIKDGVEPHVPRVTSPLLDKRPGTSPELGSRHPLLAAQRGNPEGDGEDEEAKLLQDSLSTVSKFISVAGSSPSNARYRRNEIGVEEDDDSLFDSSSAQFSRYGERYSARKQTAPPSSNKVMTPAEFEKYRRDKERQDREREITKAPGAKTADQEDDEDNYEDDEDEGEKARQQAKQRRKQEAHMAVYRQQMMKVTGESSGSTTSSRPSIQMSFSTPNLPNAASPGPAAGNASGDSDEDEEIPLAILAAHGFPNKNRPPNRLSTMGSNPNLRTSQLSGHQRPVSMIGGDAVGAGNARLPAFARNLPRDPFVGAGLVRNPVRESFSLGGGVPAPAQPAAVPPGGLIGVIANEERNRALRRGSPQIDGPNRMSAAFDPVAGIPAHMMYSGNPNPGMLSPGDQAQIQMTQQMTQFMQMQMQFMHMMAGQNGNAPAMQGGLLTSPSVNSLSGMGGLAPGLQTPQMRHSFVGNDSMIDRTFGRGEAQMRTMSMVQPSSASWIQPMQPAAGYAPSIRLGGGYAPSIAPSERSTIGLPGRYRPVSHMPPPADPSGPGNLRKSTTMSGAIPQLQQPSISVTKAGNDEDDDDEEGWEAMKAKREKKKSMWRAKKSLGDGLGSFLN
ncbi:hypothetical protein VTJ49DRAFT_4452 [Mycothermus thermophilus]|uniref:Uncharacterized protein n=1 Tax=Humicola insolens TaxID=85995 RepID=A0ABR3V5A2_HUMIN